MTVRAATGQAADQIIAKGGVVVGAAVTAQGVTDIAGAVGTVLGVVVALLSIWLLTRRLKLNKLEIERLERARDRDE